MKDFISYSDMAAFQKCRQSWDFSSPLRQALAPKIAQKSLQRGTFVHALLEFYYSGILRPTTDSLTKELQRLLDIEIARVLALDLPGEVQDTALRQAAGMAADTAGIVSNYVVWARQNDRSWFPIATETPFSMPLTLLDGRIISVRGTMDTIFESSVSNVLYVNDFKTCTTSFDPMAQHLTFYSSQARLYAWAAQKLYPQKRIAGVAFTLIKGDPPKPPIVLRNGGLSKNKTQATTWNLYKTAIEQMGLALEDYKDMQPVLERQEFVRRFTICFSVEELKRFEWIMQVTAAQMIAPDVPVYPSPDFFSCQRCAFREPCRDVQTHNILALQLHLRDSYGPSTYSDRKYKTLEELQTE